MKVVILKTNQVKEVADGYARNYLIPNGLAVAATAERVKEANEQVQQTEQANAQTQQEWKSLGKKLSSTPITVKAKANEDGTLFAAVPAKDIVSAIGRSAGGAQVQPGWIADHEPIKHTGSNTVELRFPNGTSVKLDINVQAQ